jgi:glucose-fructose oxidoreductase
MNPPAKRKKWKVAGINFDHFHMGDLLQMAAAHRQVEIVGICDAEPKRMETASRELGLPAERVFTNDEQCLEKTRPDLVILCPSTASHGEYVERLATHGTHLLLEKPFASSVKDADRMIAAARRNDIMLAINWPLRWVASHCTAYRLLMEGRIGKLEELHYYGGNRGPLYHTAGKVEVKPTPAMKRKSWFYQKAHGGGSLLDYLGYGATLGTWFHNGEKPLEVTAITFQSKGVEVDEHSSTIARYESGLSHFQTRWGTFTDPWTTQPQPKCGFVLKGTEGTISSYDYEPTVRIQTRRNPAGRDIPCDVLKPPFQNPIQYILHCLNRGEPPEGPLSTGISRVGQQIVDSAVRSARSKKTVTLVS